MIIYNVTLKVETGIVREWQQWMLQEHIPEMMSIGLFIRKSFSRLLDQDESEGLTFVAQYFCERKEDYEQYLQNHARAMQQKGKDKFGDKVIGFRTLMEVIA